MKTSLSSQELADYVRRQMHNLFPGGAMPDDHWAGYIAQALARTDFCFRHVRNKYFQNNGHVFFDHLHTDQYAIFLYYLSNSIYRENGHLALAQKIYAMNKALHAVDLFYAVELPEVFYLQHPVGTVLGRARYSNYFVAYQRCSIGSNLDGKGPTLEEGVILFGGAAVVGRCHVGRNTWFSMGTMLMDQDVPGNSVVFGHSPDIVIKKTYRNAMDSLFFTVGGSAAHGKPE